MLEGYFDESGIHEGAPFCVVAGYYGDRAQWEKFEGAWKTALAQENVAEFHAKVFFGPAPPKSRYYGWDYSRRESFLSGLLDVIVESEINPIGASLVIEDWNRLSLDERRFMTGARYSMKLNKFLSSGAPGKPYFVPFQDCIGRVATRCSSGEKAHFFFALNHQFRGYAADVYALIKSHPLEFEAHLGTIAFPTPLDAVHLQAADLLCYLLKCYLPLRMKDEHAGIPSTLKRAITHLRSIKDLPIYHTANSHRPLVDTNRPMNWSLDRGYLDVS
jgi:hypothetical protein